MIGFVSREKSSDGLHGWMHAVHVSTHVSTGYLGIVNSRFELLRKRSC
eukprot:COSAG06_NODE_62404_length_265_cov_0.620482_1_plen_47_part_10